MGQPLLTVSVWSAEWRSVVASVVQKFTFGSVPRSESTSHSLSFLFFHRVRDNPFDRQRGRLDGFRHLLVQHIPVIFTTAVISGQKLTGLPFSEGVYETDVTG